MNQNNKAENLDGKTNPPSYEEIVKELQRTRDELAQVNQKVANLETKIENMEATLIRLVEKK